MGLRARRAPLSAIRMAKFQSEIGDVGGLCLLVCLVLVKGRVDAMGWKPM